MEYLLNLLYGGAGGVIFFWSIKNWISERLRESIKHEYAEKLESFKSDLNSKIEAIKHENQVTQLRTSLFFDHQRNAFASIITMIAKLNKEWADLYDVDNGLYSPVPYDSFTEMKNLYYQHQLFLDEECLIAMSLIMKAYQKSLPYDDGSGGPLHQGENSSHLSFIEYLQPRLASIFRSKIGVSSNPQHHIDVVVLSAIELVNNYQFLDVGIPPQGSLSTEKIDNASDKVALGLMHFDELTSLLKEFDRYLSTNGGWLHDAQLQIKQTLNLISKIPNNLLQVDSTVPKS